MYRFVVALTALVCVVGTGVVVDEALGEPIAPKLRAKLKKRDDSVRLNWRTRRLNRKAVNLIEIERAHEGAAFESLDVVPRRPSRYTDGPEAGGTYEYRARVHSDDEVSAWSKVVSVRVPGAVPPPSGGPDPDIDPPGGNRGDANLQPGQRECAANTVDEVLRIVNEERRDAGRPTVQLQGQLQWAARTRSITMAHENEFSHDGWVGVVNQSGYAWSALGENIALGYTSPQHVMGAWMNSSGHRANILGGYRDVGIGCVIGRDGSPWWTQIFGR